MKYKIVSSLLKRELKEGILKDVEIMRPATPGANAVDLRACMENDLIIQPGGVELIPTGLAVSIGKNAIGMIIPRSSQGHKRGLILGNTVGNVDPDYTGEVFISCWNRGHEPQVIKPFERLVNFVALPCIPADSWEEVDELEETERGDGGFGSTGRN